MKRTSSLLTAWVRRIAEKPVLTDASIVTAPLELTPEEEDEDTPDDDVPPYGPPPDDDDDVPTDPGPAGCEPPSRPPQDPATTTTAETIVSRAAMLRTMLPLVSGQSPQ